MGLFGRKDSGSTSDAFQFTSYERDAESGADYAGARYYSSVQGRFMSPDPYDGSMDIANPQSLNRYSYVMNNPLRFTDPTGMDCQFEDGEILPDDPTTHNPGTGCTDEGGDYFVPPGTTPPDQPISLLPPGSSPPTNCGNDCPGDPDDACNGNCDIFDGFQLQAAFGNSNDPSTINTPFGPMNVSSLIKSARGLLSQGCKTKFGQTIPGYTTSRFFNTLSNATINQYPNATPPQDTSSYGADAVTHPPGGPIDLLPNFYGRDPRSQAFVLIHEGIHLFGRGNLGDSAVQKMFGLPVTGYTENITQYIAGGC